MSFISTKVLVDIPLNHMFSEPPSDAKIIFQRKKELSLESLAFRLKVAIFGGKMKQAAAARIAALCNSTSGLSDFANNIDKVNGVTTDQAKFIYIKIKMNNQLEKLVNPESPDIEFPEGINEIIHDDINSKLTEQLKNIAADDNLPTTIKDELISLLKKTQPNFSTWDEEKLNMINKNNTKDLIENPNGIEYLNASKESLNILKLQIINSGASDYKNKIETSIAKLILKIDSAIEEIKANKSEKEKNIQKETEFKNAQRKILTDKLSKLLSNHQLMPELKNMNIDIDKVFKNALLGDEKNETIKEYLIPLTHYLKFRAIAINKTSAPILEHLLKDEDNFIKSMQTKLEKKYNTNTKFQTHGRGIILQTPKVNYPLALKNILENLRQDLDEFNAMPDSEKREQVDTLDQMKNSQDL